MFVRKRRYNGLQRKYNQLDYFYRTVVEENFILQSEIEKLKKPVSKATAKKTTVKKVVKK